MKQQAQTYQSQIKKLITCLEEKGLKRWALRLIGYDFDIEYVKTEEFGKADASSRLIDESKRKSTNSEMEVVIAVVQAADKELSSIALEAMGYARMRKTFQRLTLEDPVFRHISD